MTDCPSCGTTCFLAPGGPEAVGQHGEMTEAPTLLRLGQGVWIEGTAFLPIGHALFDCGRGSWDKFWCLAGGEQDGHWIRTDEAM